MTGIGALSGDPEEAQARLREWADGFADKARRYQEAAARTEELRLSATSQNGAVRVTVRADGGVTELQLSERARSLHLAELSATILDTMRRAQARIAGEVGEVYAEELGDEDPRTRSMVLTNLRARFPHPEDDPDAPGPSERDTNSGGDPDDDFSDENPLR